MFASSKPINLEQNLWTTRILLPCIAVIAAALGALRLTIDHRLFWGRDIGTAEELLAFVFLGFSCFALTRLLAGPPLRLSVQDNEIVLSHAKSGSSLSRFSIDKVRAEAGYFRTLFGHTGGQITVLRLRVDRRLLLVAPKRDNRYTYSWHDTQNLACFSSNLAAPTHFVSDTEFRCLIRPLGLDPSFMVRPAP